MKKILVIEDEVAINDLIRMNLEIVGYESVSFYDREVFSEHLKCSDCIYDLALESIHSESGRLSRLSEKMKELTKLYEPDCRISPEPVSMETLFTAAQEGVGYRLEEKQLQLVREGAYQGEEKKLF